MGRVAGFFSKPIGWPTHTITVLAFALLCWGARLPGGDLSYVNAGLLLWAWVLLVWLVRPILRFVVLKWHGQKTPLGPTIWIHWCVAPILLIVNSLAITYDLPFRAAFRVSRPAMDRLAQTMLADGKERQKQWLGVIPISSARPISGAVELTLDKKELLWGKRGFYFSPGGDRIDNSYYYDQQRVEDGWYIWHYGGW